MFVVLIQIICYFTLFFAVHESMKSIEEFFHIYECDIYLYGANNRAGSAVGRHWGWGELPWGCGVAGSAACAGSACRSQIIKPNMNAYSELLFIYIYKGRVCVTV